MLVLSVGCPKKVNLKIHDPAGGGEIVTGTEPTADIGNSRRVTRKNNTIRNVDTLEGFNQVGVMEGDTMWEISRMVYKDTSASASDKGHLWPLLAKYNKDTVVNPDLIYPEQDLKYKRNPSTKEIQKAIQKSFLTPKK